MMTTDRMVSASELRSAAETAKDLGITPTTLTRWVLAGTITPLRSDPYIFHADDVAQVKAALARFGGRMPRGGIR